MNELDEKIEKEAELGLTLCEKGNLEEGIKHLRYAAEKNNLDAIVNLGHALKLCGNYEEAFIWTLRGAKLGHKVAISNLAIMYRKGQGTKCDVEESVKCGKKLIELGEIDGGYNEIICAYLYSEDEAQKNYSKAFEFALEGSKKVMELNPVPKKGIKCETIVKLALCYDFGQGVKKDKREALKYYSYCINCEIDIAMYNAACIYCYSDDEELKNIEAGLELFEKAIKADYADGWYQLGYLYHKGEKVTKDIERAKYYYAMAIRSGNGEEHYNDAIINLRSISEKDVDLLLSGKYCSIID